MIKLFKSMNKRYDEFDNMCYWSSLRSTNKIQLMFYILAPRTLLMLVGVILADAGLHMPDFRAGERTFSLITQVAGRAGRYFPDGKVVVQTYSPNQEPVYYACQNKIEDFYNYTISIHEIF